MRVFMASMGTETNTFASFPTGLENFREKLWVENGIAGAPDGPSTAGVKRWLTLSAAEGWEVAEGLHVRASPAGITTRTAHETMRDRILADLGRAGPVDAVLLYLHGAMVAERCDDCEGDLVARVRAMVGPKARIGVVLDLHAHVDHVIVDAADVIVFYKTYPHIDYAERADEVFHLIRRTLAGEIDPVMALFDCRCMGIFPITREGPMPALAADMAAAEGTGGILSLSLNHGFPWADVPMAGTKMLCVADGSRDLAERTARAFGERFYRSRAEATLPFTPFDVAIDEAKRPGAPPLLLADTSDQVGSGAPGDTTHILRALIAAGIRNAAVVPLWDPLAVEICFKVGEGARLPMRIGGKYEPHSGPPLDAEVEVVLLRRDAWQQQLETERVELGDIAVVRIEGIEVLLTATRVNVYSPSIFEMHGITIADKQVIAIKNLYKHSDVFRPLTRAQLYVATPGTSDPDWPSLPFRRLPRPIWPLDPDPLGLDG